jgi:hypothetical protein
LTAINSDYHADDERAVLEGMLSAICALGSNGGILVQADRAASVIAEAGGVSKAFQLVLNHEWEQGGAVQALQHHRRPFRIAEGDCMGSLLGGLVRPITPMSKW